MKHYYALTDSFTGDNPMEPTSGFANTKRPLAFRSKKERDAWVLNTKLLTAKAITRTEAIVIADWALGAHYGHSAESVKPCRLYSTDDRREAEYIILTESSN